MGKSLLHELKQYIRCLWPCAIACVVMGAIARLVVLTDRNPIEATGTITFIGLYVITAILFVVCGFIHGYRSFSQKLTSEKAEITQPINEFLWSHICAFMIFIVVTALLVIASAMTFAWESVGKMFLSLKGSYFLEVVLYATIFIVTVYIVPIAMITAEHFRTRKKLTYMGVKL